MNNEEIPISPKFQMELVNKIEKTLWSTFLDSKYKNVLFYIEKWHESDMNWENFIIHKNDNDCIDLLSTLHSMDGRLLLKIAIDLDIETPNFIPSVPVFRNNLKTNYKSAYKSFSNAIKHVDNQPSFAVGLANSTLESIVKHILSDENVDIKLDKKKTLYALTQDILKAFKMFPIAAHPQSEICNIGSSLLKCAQNIEALRSEKTDFHGKTDQDYIVDDPIYAYFAINTITTVGLFLLSFYTTKYKVKDVISTNSEIRSEDLPF